MNGMNSNWKLTSHIDQVETKISQNANVKRYNHYTVIWLTFFIVLDMVSIHALWVWVKVKGIVLIRVVVNDVLTSYAIYLFIIASLYIN